MPAAADKIDILLLTGHSSLITYHSAETRG